MVLLCPPTPLKLPPTPLKLSPVHAAVRPGISASHVARVAGASKVETHELLVSMFCGLIHPVSMLVSSCVVSHHDRHCAFARDVLLVSGILVSCHAFISGEFR